LRALKNTDLPGRIFTDSNYAYGVLALGWKVRANREMVESIKKLMAKFTNLKLIKVKGHAGQEGNERADFLATSAIKQAKSRK
jgi:ribonuclease HI